MTLDINIWAVLIATIVAQAIGAGWYMALADPWMAAVGLTREEIKGNPTRMPYLVALVAAFVLSLALAALHELMNTQTIGQALMLGVVAGLGIAAAAMAPHYAFSGRKLTLYLIDAGHALTLCVVLSLITGFWR